MIELQPFIGYAKDLPVTVLVALAIAYNAACGLILFVGLRSLRKATKLFEHLRDIPTSRISSIQPGLRKVCGRLLAADPSSELTSPLQSIKCVRFKMVASKSKGSGPSATTVVVKKEVKNCKAVLDDETGCLSIKLMRLAEVQTKFKGVGRFGDSLYKKRFEERYELSSKGLNISEEVWPSRQAHSAFGEIVRDEATGQLQLTNSPIGSFLLPISDSAAIALHKSRMRTLQGTILLLVVAWFAQSALVLRADHGSQIFWLIVLSCLVAFALLKSREAYWVKLIPYELST